MIYSKDCDLISDMKEENCESCYRYEICKKYFTKHPDEIYCPDEIKLKGDVMTIIVELELDSPYDLTQEEIEKDLRLGESEIGWNYDYKIKSVEVT